MRIAAARKNCERKLLRKKKRLIPHEISFEFLEYITNKFTLE